MSERMLSSGSKREDTRAARPSHYWVGIPIFRIPNPGIPAEFYNPIIPGLVAYGLEYVIKTFITQPRVL